MILLAVMIFGPVVFIGGYRLGVGDRPQVPSVRCHAYEGIVKDVMEKNKIIHRLEKRIFQLKRANRNLRLRVNARKEQS